MKRAGQLMDAIVAPDNLRLGFWKAAKGKRAKADCREFGEELEAGVAALRQELLAGTVHVGNYSYFTIHDPKQRTQALLAFVMAADTLAYRRHVMERFGVVANGLQPGDPRWQLEQQRQELPGHEPQQQLAGQQEQQHRIPVRPPPSSTEASGDAAADPAAILSPAGLLPGQTQTESPPGASSLAEPGENSRRVTIAG